MRADGIRPYGKERDFVNKKIIPWALLCALLLGGCQWGEEATAASSPPPESVPKTAQELLEEQIIDDTHDAFLVDTGGRLGTLLVTVEAVPYEKPAELNTYQHVVIWNPAHMDQALQTVDWEGGYPDEHQVLDVNFDGYQDFTCLYARGVQAELYHCMRWDEEQGLFVEEPEYANISSPWVRPETQTISGWNRSSGAGDGVSTVHKWIKGELVCVRRIETFKKEWTDYNSPFVLTVKDRIDGELMEIYRTEFPADSSKYLTEQMEWENLDYHGEAGNQNS